MKVIIFYGTDCDGKTAWIPWLKEQLTNQGIECVIPNLPTPENQTYASWAEITKKIDLFVSKKSHRQFSLRHRAQFFYRPSAFNCFFARHN